MFIMDNKSERISIRIGETEQKKIKEIQDKANIPVSQIVRQSICDMKAFFTCENHRKEKAATFRHIAKTGNNLNQIAHQLNSAYLVGELDYEHIAFAFGLLHNISYQLNTMSEVIKKW